MNIRIPRKSTVNAFQHGMRFSVLMAAGAGALITLASVSTYAVPPATAPSPSTVQSPAAVPSSSTAPAKAARKPRAVPLVISVDREVANAEAAVKARPTEADTYVALSAAFLRKARESVDGSYYLRAEAACDKALSLDPKNYSALRLIGFVYVGEHRFAEGVAAARRAIALNPKDPWNYGTLGDGLAELGDYEGAEAAIQQMVDLRPGVTAYTRISYLRELFGDPEGAIEMMSKAVAATSAREPEHAAWARTQLGNLFFATGKLQLAGSEYEAAMRYVPEYHAALAGRGRVLAAQGKTEEAVRDLERSLQLVPMHETAAYLADLYTSLKRPEEAAKKNALVETIEKLNESNKFPPEYQIVLYYADHDQNVAAAVKIGEKLVKERKDVRTMDALAWAYYKAGQFPDAANASKQALRLETKDALYYFHAGMIQSKLGQRQEAVASLETALSINPSFHPIHATEARTAISQLRLSSNTPQVGAGK